MDHKENEVEDLERVFTDANAEPIQISYAVVKSITKNFGQVVGHGAFGVVYLGAVRNGLVAVKKLSYLKDFSDTQFLEEVKCLKKVNHKNIVRFLGYCADTQGVVMEIEGKVTLADVQQRLLCFEYVPNGNLHHYIQEKNHGYEWSTCYQIIKGICHGLHYLHQLRINHLDLKPANVLLGAQMEPKITDFGLSRCIDGNQSTIFTTNLRGTPGYIAPELIDEKKISFKSDIFSLGIIMTRLLTGSNESIAENWHESLNTDCQQMKKCMEIAKMCADYDPSKRPTTSEIIYKLNETETTVQKISPVVSEPRYNPTSTLYQVINRFWTLPAQTPREYYRWLEMRPVEPPMLKLTFRSPLQTPVITHNLIKDESGNPLEIILVHVNTGSPKTLPEALRLELFPLFGDFPPNDRKDWSTDDFHRCIVKHRYGRRPLLVGQVSLTMRDGRATVNELQFTDNYSSWIRCRMFRIGVRVVPGSYDGTRIIEAMTEAFVVRHGDPYQKHYPPVLGDYVWRLEKISKEGRFHTGLGQNDIVTVQEFLGMLTVKPDELRAILGDGMTHRMWAAVTNHARTCKPGNEVYAYSTEFGTIYVNSIFDLIKVEIDGVVWLPSQMDPAQTGIVRKLILEAYEHRPKLQKITTRFPFPNEAAN